MEKLSSSSSDISFCPGSPGCNGTLSTISGRSAHGLVRVFRNNVRQGVQAVKQEMGLTWLFEIPAETRCSPASAARFAGCFSSSGRTGKRFRKAYPPALRSSGYQRYSQNPSPFSGQNAYKDMNIIKRPVDHGIGLLQNRPGNIEHSLWFPGTGNRRRKWMKIVRQAIQ